MSEPDLYRYKIIFCLNSVLIDICGLKVQHGALLKFPPAVLCTLESTSVVSLLCLLFSDQLVPKKSEANILFLMWSHLPQHDKSKAYILWKKNPNMSTAPCAYLYCCQSGPKDRSPWIFNGFILCEIVWGTVKLLRLSPAEWIERLSAQRKWV